MIWDAAVLNELYVCESHRGTGLADDLLEAALDRARGQDLPVERIVLDVGSGNERAGAVYERHGFEPWPDARPRALKSPLSPRTDESVRRCGGRRGSYALRGAQRSCEG